MNDVSLPDLMTVVQEQQHEIVGLKLANASLRRRLEEAQAAGAPAKKGGGDAVHDQEGKGDKSN